jgi:translocation and assembly module TamB
VKRALWVALAALALLPAWLLATEAGLRAGVALAERLSGGAVSVREAHGRLAGDVRLLGIEVATPAATVSIGQADVNLRLTRLLVGRVQAERLAVQQLGVTVHARAPEPAGAARRPLSVRAPLRLAVEDGEITGFTLRLASGREWTLPRAQFAARWRAEWIVIARLAADTREAGPVALRGRVAITDDLLQFEDFEVTQPSPLRIEGALALTQEEESALRLSWERLAWPGGARLGWLASPQGTLALEGPWRRYAWSLDARAVAADVAAEVDARGHGDLRSLALEDVRAGALGGTLRATGAVAWSPDLTTDLELAWQSLDPAQRFADWTGRLNGEATLHARWGEAPQVEFDARLADSELRGYPLALQARGRTERDTVQLHELLAQTGASELRASGGLWPRLGLRGSLRSGDFGSLAAGLAGAGEAQFTAQGEPATARVTLRAGAQALAWRGLRAGSLALDASVSRAGRSEVTLRLQGAQAGIDLDEVVLTAAGTEARHALTFDARGAEGAATLALSGGMRRGEWHGELTRAALAPPGEAPFELEEPAATAFRRGALRLEPACLRGPGSRACVDLDLRAGAQRIAFRIDEFALARLKPWLPPDWAVSGTISGTAAVQLRDGELAALRADLAGSAGAIDGDGVRLEYGPGALRVLPDDDGRLNAVIELAPAGGSVHGDVWVTAGGALLDRPMLGDLRVKLPDLAWLPVLSPEIAAAQGSIDAELSVSGTLRGPSLAGRLQVADGRVRLATPGIELTDIAASFDRGRDAPLNAHLSAKSGDGQFTLDGVLRAMQPKLDGEFKLKGENVLGVNTSELRAWITPDLTLELDGRAARLTGELGVPRAEITPRRIRGGGIAPTGDQVVASADPQARDPGLQVESQVRIVLGDKVRFDGLGLKTRLEGAIAAHDEVGRPTTGRGELRLVGGRYKAYGQDLIIETGRLLFNGGPITDPAIDLQAYRELPANPQMTRVGLRARGTLAAPEFSLYSDSSQAISQEEQLSWLVLGRSLSSTETTTGQADQFNDARASLGLAGGDLVAQQLAPRLGLDEVSVGARPGETTELARLTIGKYLSPRLFLSYGVGLFQPGHFFRLQYDLSRRFKLQGESGLNQGGDLLYSVETGGKKKEEAAKEPRAEPPP